jgi:hypothetical protein
VNLPLRKLAVLWILGMLAMLGAGAPVRADDSEGQVVTSDEESHADRTMTIYPADVEPQNGRTAFISQPDDLIPAPTIEMPAEDIPLISPPTGRARSTPSRSAVPDDVSPSVSPPIERRGTSGLMGAEEIPPPLMGGTVVGTTGDTVYPYDPASVTGQSDMQVSPWGGEAPAAVWSTGEWFQSGIWYTTADFVVVRRSRPDDRILIGIDTTNPDNLFFNYGGSAGVEPAMRLTVGRFIGRDWANRDHSVEFTFFGINEFRTGHGIQSQSEGGLVLLLDQKQGGFNGADVWTTEYGSRFYSLETNMRLRHRPDKDRLVMAPDGTWTRQYTSSYMPSMLLGLRYINLNEDFDFRSRSFAVSEDLFTGNYEIETHNDLVGVQIGGDFINQRETWHWGVRGKLGAFVNFAEQSSVLQVNDLRAPGPGAPGDPSIDNRNRVEEASKANGAFFGEMSLMAAYHFTPNFSARASYDFLWLAGTGLAPDQLTFSETARLDLDGVIFYQGLSLGLEVIW